MSLASFDPVDVLGYLGAACVLGAFSVRRVSLLRSISIVGNITFICYAALSGANPVLFMNAALLLLNIYRLSQQVLEARAVSSGAKSPSCAA